MVVFVLAHDLIFLVTYGTDSGAALEATGHRSGWTATVALVVALALVLVITGAVRLAQLSQLARQVGRGGMRVQPVGDETLVADLARRWVWILLGSLVLFVISENIEHLAVGMPPPGLAVLGSAAYDATLPIFAAVAFAAALIDALYRWRHGVLLARIVAACGRWASLPRRWRVRRSPGSIAGTGPSPATSSPAGLRRSPPPETSGLIPPAPVPADDRGAASESSFT